MPEAPDYYFDESAAERAVEFFPLFLRHTKGAMAGQPFTLLEWQQQIIRDLFGWKRADGSRRYRTAYIEIPRKNGKSTFAAGIALYLLLCDGEQGAEIYSAASTREQASLVYNMARDMVSKEPMLEEALTVRDSRKTIIHRASNSFYRAIPADAAGAHGFNAHGIIFDELHTQPNRELWDVLTTSTGARKQPLTVAITTAGHDRSSICWELHQKAVAILGGDSFDDSFYPVLFTADVEDDWTDPQVWAKANPSLGHGVSLEYLEQECKKAQDSPAYENTFRNLHLDQWTEQASRIISMARWDQCEQVFSDHELEGCECYAGLDLASTSDITACVLVFPHEDETFSVLPYFWMPEENINRRVEQDRRQVNNYIQQGLIETTPGNELDCSYLVDSLIGLFERFDIQSIGYDPWNATAIMQMLQEQGIEAQRLKKLSQSYSTYNQPFKRLLSIIGAGRLIHDGNPVLRWMASNTAHSQDASGNIRPDKGKSGEKIDGICALLMGLGLAINNETDMVEYQGSGEILYYE